MPRRREARLAERARRARGPELAGTNLERAGDHNQRVTLHAIRINGPVTRAELARTTGLTAQSVANIARRLIKEGLVVEAGHARGARGQPATRLRINAEGCFAIGLNVDRDHVTMILLDFEGRVRSRISREIAFAAPAAVRAFAARGLKRLLADAEVSRADVIGVGVAFPDDLTRTRLPDQPDEYSVWARTPVDRLVGDALGLPVIVENDAAAAAIGELQFGAGHTYRNFFYLLVTAALGGGVVVHGSYFRGADGKSGEIGWLPATDAAGRATQLQKIVSLSGLRERLAAAGHRVGAPSDLSALDGHGAGVVDAWLDECAGALVGPLVAVNCLVNPDAILIGGRLPAPLVDRLAAGVAARLAREAPALPALAQVTRATLADDAPAVGAAILAFSERFLPTRFALLKHT